MPFIPNIAAEVFNYAANERAVFNGFFNRIAFSLELFIKKHI